MMKLKIAPYVLFFSLACAITVSSHSGSIYLPEGCGSCHVGHGMSAEPMLPESQEKFCYKCHGSEENRSEMKSQGKLAEGAVLADIQREFAKPYRHPVEEALGHSPIEKLPNFDGANTSHAECVDCHNPHQKVNRAPGKADEVAGYSVSGQYLKRAVREYEICFKCHSETGANRDSDKDIRRQFATTKRSMHPVTRPIAGAQQYSLKTTLTSGGLMKCTDCHASDDPDGPAGPHGSIYPGLLKGNYEKSGKMDESPLAYQLCYGCHERTSILENESFPLHREHIIGDPLNSIPGTSCFTCHASHSSDQYNNLIKFNPEMVGPSASGNRVFYRSTGEKTGQCYLMCHGYDHGPADY